MTDTVAIVRSNSRDAGINEALNMLRWRDIIRRVTGYVLVKPNCMNGHPCPCTTSPETLRALCNILASEVGLNRLVIGDGSSMFEKDKEHWTQDNMKKLGWLDIPVGRHAFFEEEEEILVTPKQKPELTLYFPKTVIEASKIVYVPVMKVHSMPAPFSLALKNTVGSSCYRTRQWLHGRGDFDENLALLNLGLNVDLVVIDCSQMLLSDGPHYGKSASSNLYLASNSRFAADVVGGLIMKHLGTEFKCAGVPLPNQNVLELPHIKYAEEYGLGRVKDIRIETNFKDGLTSYIEGQLSVA